MNSLENVIQLYFSTNDTKYQLSREEKKSFIKLTPSHVHQLMIEKHLHVVQRFLHLEEYFRIIFIWLPKSYVCMINLWLNKIIFDEERLGPGKSTALLSAFRNSLSASMLMLRFPLLCYVSVLPAGGEGGVRLRKRKVC